MGSEMIKIFMIYDTRGETTVGNMYTARTPAAAIRGFSDVLKDKNAITGAHPQDFNLLWTGDLDEDGTITPAPDGPEVIMTGKTMVELMTQTPEK